MGLIDKSVEIVVTGNILRHYENLGYKIPKYTDRKGIPRVKHGTKIIVDIQDLMKSSTAKVCVECDNCNKRYYIPYIAYNQHNKSMGFYCQDCYRQITMRRENNPNWNFNKTDEERIIDRNYDEYKNFVKRVLERGKHTCYCCGTSEFGKIEVHHLNGYDWCKEMRTDETNALCLCSNCHTNFHIIYGRGQNTKEQFEEWIKHSVGELGRYNGILPTARKVICLDNLEIFDSVADVANRYDVTLQQIYDCCNHKPHHKSAKGYHFLWHEEYLGMTEFELKEYIEFVTTNERYSKVVCLNTGQVYKSAKHAGIDYGKPRMNVSIIKCCKGSQHTAGTDENTGERLQWMYYDDYIKLEGL